MTWYMTGYFMHLTSEFTSSCLNFIISVISFQDNHLVLYRHVEVTVTPLLFLLVRLNLTLISLKPKVINLCHQYRARPTCTSMQSDQALYSVNWPSSNSHFDTSKMKMYSAKNGRWIIQFKKFGRLRVNITNKTSIPSCFPVVFILTYNF